MKPNPAPRQISNPSRKPSRLAKLKAEKARLVAKLAEVNRMIDDVPLHHRKFSQDTITAGFVKVNIQSSPFPFPDPMPEGAGHKSDPDREIKLYCFSGKHGLPVYIHPEVYGLMTEYDDIHGTTYTTDAENGNLEKDQLDSLSRVKTYEAMVKQRVHKEQSKQLNDLGIATWKWFQQIGGMQAVSHIEGVEVAQSIWSRIKTYTKRKDYLQDHDLIKDVAALRAQYLAFK